MTETPRNGTPLKNTHPPVSAELRALIAQLRGVIAAKDEQIASLTAVADAAVTTLRAERELRRRQELRIAELERL
jgi:hypothetical protein